MSLLGVFAPNTRPFCAHSATLRVGHLPAGVYSYALLVEGATVATRRLLITR